MKPLSQLWREFDNLVFRVGEINASVNPWVTSGANLYYDSGQVWIGETSGSHLFEVNGDSQIKGGIQIGTTSDATAGMLRWNGATFQGYDGATWNSFATSSSGIWSLNGLKAYYNDGNVGIGTNNPDGVFHAVSSTAVSNLPFFEIKRVDSSNFNTTSLNLLATKSTDMGDGFGVGLSFYIKDNAGINNRIGRFSLTRAGADNTGEWNFETIVAGSFSKTMTLSSSGNLDIPGTIRIRGGSPVAGYFLTCDNNGIGSWSAYSPTSGNLTATSPISMSATRQLLGGAAAISISQAGVASNGYLSSTDWNTFNNKQGALTTGNLTANGPLSFNNTISVIGGSAAISISQSGSGSSGYLSSTDWNTFNNKQDALTTGLISGPGVISITGSRYVIGGSASVSISQAGSGSSGYLSSTDWNTFNNKQDGGASQPLDATLTALAGLNSTAGFVYETGADAFTKYPFSGTGSANSVAHSDHNHDSDYVHTSTTIEQTIVMTVDQTLTSETPAALLELIFHPGENSVYTFKAVITYKLDYNPGTNVSPPGFMAYINTTHNWITQLILMQDVNETGGGYPYAVWSINYYNDQLSNISSPGHQFPSNIYGLVIIEGMVSSIASASLYIYGKCMDSNDPVIVKAGSSISYKKVA